jgi:8-amino-7-oxononanoate synthase
MAPFERRIATQLARQSDEGLYRYRRTVTSPQGPTVQVDGQPLLNFCSNDYLGLASHPALLAAWAEGARRFGVGSGASHLVCGHSEAHEQLEHALAKLTGRERALVFSSGYAANLGVLTALLQPGDAVFEDRLNHASLLDGGLFSGARFSRFQHNNVVDLDRRLARTPGEARLVAVDAVYSMDGDIAPLTELAELCQRHDAWLMADDAHGFGLYGDRGEGIAAQLPIAQLPILMATLGKAIGVQGAFVAGSDALIELLIQRARSYIYTTAMSPAAAFTAAAALQLLSDESWRRDHLRRLIALLRGAAAAHQLPIMPSDSAIQPLLVGSTERALQLSADLYERGIWVAAIRPPTVPSGTARLRITLSAAHSESQVILLVETLAKIWQRAPSA